MVSNTNGHVNGDDGKYVNGYGLTNGVNGTGQPAVPEPIAIVGMGMRLPGGIHTEEAFWDLLINKKTTRGPIPSSRYNVDGFFTDSDRPGSTGIRYGHFLGEADSLDTFDTSFFNISKAEVEKLDPQQRMLLEVVWECMENAGQRNWRGSNTGVFVGTWGDDWCDFLGKDPQQAGGMLNVLGAHDYAIANRISYEYDLRGPSFVVKTACSSSMICLHQAVQAIRNSECDAAIVAGTNLIITPTQTIAQTEGGVLSPTGECRTFDATANGYSRGEAINAILLKKLSSAVRDRDSIRAVIRSTAVNCDGRSAGLSTPNPKAHARLIRQAYKVVGLDDPSETPLVEVHGTGTKVGDPLEVEAITEVFGNARDTYLSGVKANVGHGESASGITSIIKAALILQHRTIPPQANFSTPNPKIPFEEARLIVPLEATLWPKGRPERISVNSFGITGANAHAVIESAASYTDVAWPGNHEAIQGGSRAEILLISATNTHTLKHRAKLFQEFAFNNPRQLADLSHSLASRREQLSHRAYCITSGSEEREVTFGERPKSVPQLTFVFTGQGAQWPAMGKELIEQFPSFRHDIEQMGEHLKQLPHPPSWNLLDELLLEGMKSRVSKSEFSQPLCTAVQVALVNLLKVLGISPGSVLGHSSGEIGAAYAAGSLSAEGAVTVAYYRGLVTLKSEKQGVMAAIGIGRAEAALYLEKGAVIACDNSPQSATLSGDEDAVDATIAAMKADDPNIFARRLKTDGMAYHSPHMADSGLPYESYLKDLIKAQEPTIAFYSSVTGKRITGDTLDANYWRQNLESQVRFYPAAKAAIDAGGPTQLFLEIGPHSALAGPLRQIFHASSSKAQLHYCCSLVRGKDARNSILDMCGKLYLQSVPMTLEILTPGARLLTNLPNYPWRHDVSLWAENRATKEWRQRKFPPHELLGSRIFEDNDFEPRWRNILRLKDAIWLQDHKVYDDVVFPCAGYIAMIGEAARQVTGSSSFTIRGLNVKAALVLQDKGTELMTSFKRSKYVETSGQEWYDFSIISHNGTLWTYHCDGRVSKSAKSSVIGPPAEIIKDLPRQVPSPYDTFESIGLNYGPVFQGLEFLTTLPGHKTAVATLKDQPDTASPYAIHPATIDQCLQLLGMSACEGLSRHLKRIPLPTGIDKFTLTAPGADTPLRAKAVTTNTSSQGNISGTITVMQESQTVLSINGIHLSVFEDPFEAPLKDTIAAAQLSWRPHAEFVPLQATMVSKAKDPSEIQRIEEYGLLCTAEMQHRIADMPDSAWHFTRFRQWIDDRVAEACRMNCKILQNGKDLISLTDHDRLNRMSELRELLQTSPFVHVAELITRLVDNCVGIFNGTKEVLELYLIDGALTKLYSITGDRINSSEFFVTLGHTYPTLRVLEIGAGTGGTTMVALKALTSINKEPMYSRYTFTDISSGFFNAAADRFKDFPGMEFKTLDISKDPVEQGFELGNYDLIIASNVIHATDRLSVSLKNVRRLLSPHGRFYLQELTPAPAKMINIIMGPLPGWWLGEADGRVHEPIVSIERWDQLLREAGFDGIECAVQDDLIPDFAIGANIIAKPIARAPQFPSVTLLFRPEQRDFLVVRSLKKALESRLYHVDECNFGEAIPPHQDVISLVDLQESFFDHISAENLSVFQKMLAGMTSARMLWLMGSAQLRSSTPGFGLSIGAIRAIRAEMEIPLATLEIDNVADMDSETVVKVLENYLDQSAGLTTEQEYALKDGIIHVGRFHWVDTIQELCEAQEVSKCPLRAHSKHHGQLTSVQWEPQPAATVGDGDVLIRPRYIEIDSMDVLNYTDTQLSNVSGEVIAAGSAVEHLRAGDQVMAICNVGAQTTICSPADRVARVPQGLSMDAAARLPLTFATAIHCLTYLAHVQSGQSVLVGDPTSGSGTAAIQICAVLGAKAYVFDDVSPGEADTAEVAAIPGTVRLTRQELVKITPSRGIDVVFNAQYGSLLELEKFISSRAKVIDLTTSSGTTIPSELLTGTRTLFRVDMREEQELFPELLREMLQLYSEGKIDPFSQHSVIEAAQLDIYFSQASKNPTNSTLLIELPSDVSLLPVYRVPVQLELKEEAAYVIVGGLGGLGKALSTYLVEHGARHIVYLSRSAASEKHASFIHELEVQDCTVFCYACDISDMESVQTSLSNIKAPIAGLFHLGMVLCDQPFLSMSHSDWQTAIQPKVNGTWNLHNALVSLNVNLDFFVMFSSISSAFGLPHQANYAAGCAFQDTFVQYCHNLGLAASSINIGVISGVGYVSETPAAQEFFRSAGMPFMSDGELFQALSLSIRQQHRREARSSNTVDVKNDTAPPNGRATTSVGQAWQSYTSDPGWTSSSHLTLGLRAAKPMTDPTNRVLWKRDRRADIYRNIEAARLNIQSQSGSGTSSTAGKADILADLLAKLNSSTDFRALLDAQETLDTLSESIGRFIYESMLKDVGEEEEMELSRSLIALGVDSLVTIEVRNWLRRRLAVEVSTLEMLNGRTVLGLAELVRDRLRERASR